MKYLESQISLLLCTDAQALFEFQNSHCIMTFTDLSSLTDQATIGTHLSSAPKKSISTKLAANPSPKAQNVQAGSGDLCFSTDTLVDEVLKTFQEQKVEVRQFLVLRYDVESYLNEGARDWPIIFSTRERLVNGD